MRKSIFFIETKLYETIFTRINRNCHDCQFLYKTTASGSDSRSSCNKENRFRDLYSKDYSDAYYDNALAEVRLSIAKASYKDDKTTIVWDTTYNFRQFKQYPQMAQKHTIEKTVEHYENSETLQVSTVVMYNFNGYRSMEAKGDPVLANQKYKLATVSF